MVQLRPPLGVTAPEAARAPVTGSSSREQLGPSSSALGDGAVGPSFPKLQGGPFLATPEMSQ